MKHLRLRHEMTALMALGEALESTHKAYFDLARKVAKDVDSALAPPAALTAVPKQRPFRDRPAQNAMQAGR